MDRLKKVEQQRPMINEIQNKYRNHVKFFDDESDQDESPKTNTKKPKGKQGKPQSNKPIHKQ